MSLVMVMVGMAVAMVLALAVATIGKNMAQISLTSMVQNDLQQELFLLQASLSDTNTCTAIFAGEALTPNVRELQGKQLYYPVSETSTTLGQTRILASQDPSQNGRISLSKIQISRIPGSANLARLALTFDAPAETLGGSLRQRVMSMQVQTDSTGKIIRCSTGAVASQDGGDTNGPQGQACGPSPGGFKYSGSKGAVQPTAQDYQNAVSDICAAQSYPVSQGLKISAQQQKSCANMILNNSGSASARNKCFALVSIANSESIFYNNPLTTPRPSYQDVTLQKRTGYSSPADCNQQFAYSEGDGAMSIVESSSSTSRYMASAGAGATKYVCSAGKWIGIDFSPPTQPVNTGMGGHGGSGNSAGGLGGSSGN